MSFHIQLLSWMNNLRPKVCHWWNAPSTSGKPDVHELTNFDYSQNPCLIQILGKHVNRLQKEISCSISIIMTFSPLQTKISNLRFGRVSHSSTYTKISIGHPSAISHSSPNFYQMLLIVLECLQTRKPITKHLDLLRISGFTL